MKQRLDQLLTNQKLVSSRSQAESYIKLGVVFVNGKQVIKPGYFVDELAKVELKIEQQYVSRAALKLASVANIFKLDFKNKVVLDVGSSTGGFTDYAIKHGAKKVIAVDVGTNQLHPTLRSNPKIELYEQTNILDIRSSMLEGRKNTESKNLLSNLQHQTSTKNIPNTKYQILNTIPDIILIDVSFVSLRDILPHIAKYLADKNTLVVAMLKPQFEAGDKSKHKGVIKNNKLRRQILNDFELWAKQNFVIQAKADSEVAGAQGNQERFYLLRKV